MLLPLVIVSVLGAGVTTILSQYLGRRWAEQQVRQRVASISRSLEGSSYPLTSNVLDSLVQLTGAEFIVTRAQRLDTRSKHLSQATQIEYATIRITDEDLSDFLERSVDAKQAEVDASGLANDVPWQQRRFFVFRLERPVATQRQFVLLLFDTSRVDQTAQRAAWLPLVTGFSVLALLVGTSLIVIGQLIRRLRRVSDHVRLVASGDFETQLEDRGTDEISRVAQSVDSMAQQLDALWGQVRKQQSAKLLYQVASGMSHQLRNTLTGAKMALQLHDRNQRSQGQPTSEELQVALEQMQIAEDYVQRLLVVGKGKQERDEPARLSECIASIQRTTSTVAKHLGVDLTFQIESEPTSANLEQPAEFSSAKIPSHKAQTNKAHGEQVREDARHQKWERAEVRDGRSFDSAVTNLILNALQASSQVEAEFRLSETDKTRFETATGKLQEAVDGQIVMVEVRDYGSGIDPKLVDSLFDPFVTTKPEGMGLGLSVVKQVAEHLGGRIEWSRREPQTIFRFSCPIHLPASENSSS